MRITVRHTPRGSVYRTSLVAIASAVDSLPLGAEQPCLIKVRANLNPTLVVLFFGIVSSRYEGTWKGSDTIKGPLCIEKRSYHSIYSWNSYYQWIMRPFE